MQKSTYQMTTVCKYVELLDNELSAESKKLRANAEKYLLKMRKSRRADENALELEKLLA